MFDLTDKKVLVLGGAGAIGKEICIQLIQQGLKKLAVIDVICESTAKKTFIDENFNSVSFAYKQCSVTDKKRLAEVMNYLKLWMDGLDIVINSVGILDEQRSEQTIDINYGGVVNSTFAAIDLMRKDKNGGNGGVVINIASITSFGAHFWLPVYAGTKHAVLGFTRSLKNDKFLELTGVKFMVICPGVTRTPLATREAFVDKHCFPEMKEEVERILNTYPVQDVDCVGKCVLKALDDGENGSTWQCENNRIEKNKNELETLMTNLKSEMGGLDIVINAVGVLKEQNPKLMIEINYGGVVNSTLTAIKLMRKDHSGNGGFIINIASVAGLHGTFLLPIYSGTKHAVLGFTQSLCNEAFYAKTGLKFITICPGLTETPMTNPDSLFGDHLFPEMLDEVQNILSPYPSQGPDAVGKGILAALDDGENGAVWQIENNRSEKVELKQFPILK
ncbi:alcohol dehydrogenase-like [Culicoides brevitarsis]|uniref:alcohol dehydrogenase-like n=1 Tax=Culicoides brevitarsis TaxID=469753 RepID=UPI00307CA9FF